MTRQNPRPGDTPMVTPGRLDWYRDETTLERVEANVAYDEALLDQAEDEGLAPVLRFWQMPRLAVVLGASSRLDREVRVEACRRDGVVITRRSSGGGTVLIGPGVLCVAVIVPMAFHPDLWAVDTAQAYILGRSARALTTDRHRVELRGHGDLTVEDRKFSGSAQRRLRRHLLVHFTLLYDFDLALMETYLGVPSRVPDYRLGRGHLDFVANLPLNKAEIIARLDQEWRVPPSDVKIPVANARIERVLADRMDREGWVERFR